MKRRSLLLFIAMFAAMFLGACAGVLGLDRKTPSHVFEHRAHVTKGVSCVTCHEGIGGELEEKDIHLPARAKCVQCHEKPHDERDCAGCHGEPHVREGAAMARDHLKFQHEKHVRRVHGDCVRCHQEVALERPEKLRPTMATCFTCHQHEEQWRTRDCDGCHRDLPAERVMPASHVVHEGDWLREHGLRAASSRDLCSTCHSERMCASCHVPGVTPGLPAHMTFDEPRIDGLHRAGFMARHADESRANPGLCSSCHSESTCNDCHTRNHVGASATTQSPHPRGWISTGRGGGEHGTQARIDPASCASCHGGAGEALCVSCHKVGGPGGNPHGPGFHSTKNKTHDVPCRSCHAVSP